jgi:hypothetical protein
LRRKTGDILGQALLVRCPLQGLAEAPTVLAKGLTGPPFRYAKLLLYKNDGIPPPLGAG